MRLIGTNYSQLDETITTASSANVNFPVSNIKHSFRSKQWRSNASGNFEITTNNKINFKESAMGSELTATVTAGTYTSTTLAAHIKSVLDLTGADTYTVAFSQTTGLWTISSDGSYLALLNNTGTNQANSILKDALGFANSDRTGALTYTGANIAIHNKEWLLFDLITTEEINSVVMLWPKEDGIMLSSNAVIKIQGNATNVWTAPAVDETLTIDNTYEIASHYFTADQSYRFWRVVIIDPSNVNLYVNMGVVILGKSEVIDNPDNGFSYSLTDTSRVITTDFGHEYVDEYPMTAQLEFNFSILDYDSAMALDALYRQVGSRKPVFIAMDHDASVFNKDHFSLYGKFRTNLQLNHISFDMFNGKLTIGENS